MRAAISVVSWEHFPNYKTFQLQCSPHYLRVALNAAALA